MTDAPTRVLFVCLGNICRSPLAEGLFLHLAEQQDMLNRFAVDSAGTSGWHTGNRADPRSISVAQKHGVRLPSRARKVLPGEKEHWDLVLAMDTQNRHDLIGLGFESSRTHLIREFDPAASDFDVPDPYYGGDDGFDKVYAMLLAACEGLLEKLIAESSV